MNKMDTTIKAAEKKSTSLYRKCLRLLLGVILISGFTLYMLDLVNIALSNNEVTPILNHVTERMDQVSV